LEIARDDATSRFLKFAAKLTASRRSGERYFIHLLATDDATSGALEDGAPAA